MSLDDIIKIFQEVGIPTAALVFSFYLVNRFVGEVRELKEANRRQREEHDKILDILNNLEYKKD